jgi:hypothetical protein
MGQTFKFGTTKNTDLMTAVTYYPTINNGFDLERIASNSNNSGTFDGLTNYFGTYPPIPPTKTLYFKVTGEILEDKLLVLSHKNQFLIPHLQTGSSQSVIVWARITIYEDVDGSGNFINPIVSDLDIKPNTFVNGSNNNDGSYKFVSLSSYIPNHTCPTTPTFNIYYTNFDDFNVVDAKLSPIAVDWNSASYNEEGFRVEEQCGVTVLESISSVGSLDDYPHLTFYAGSGIPNSYDFDARYSITYIQV